MIEAVQGILSAIVGRELQLVEAWRSHALAGSWDGLLGNAIQVW
jgi:mRNA-degrading endonuclease YafQ of YafQ-DinJ toxin-antitoxin module